MPTAAVDRTSWWAGVLFLVIGAVHLTALLAGWPITTYTQWLLVPPLIAHLLLRCRTVRSPLVRWAVLALALSWLGDSIPTLLPERARLLTSIVFFGLAHASWVLAFRPFVRQSILASRPQLLVPYAIAMVGLIGLCIPGAGALWPAVLVYGLLLVTMPVLATGVGVLTTWGGIAFVVTGSLIAVRAFVPGVQLPSGDAIIMTTYLLAQGLLVTGVLAAGWRVARRPLPAELAARG